jgi:hypothetical protein
MARSRAAWLAVAALALAAALVVPLWWFVLRDTSGPVSLEEVIEEFRSSGASAAAAPQAFEGVYVYDTAGYEETDALFGARHDYPRQTTLTVTAAGCGVLLRWDALEERSTTWELCPGDGVWTIAAYREVHAFFGNTVRTEYRCDPGSPWWPAGEAAGYTWTRHCSTGETTETALGTSLGPEVAGPGELAATHLSLETTLEGATRGRGTFDLWLEESTGFPLRIAFTNDNKTGSAIGDVRYTEQVELELTSLEPRR